MRAEGGSGAAYIGGGTLLIADGRPEPGVLVDLTAAGLSGVRSEGGGLVVGATTTMLELAEDRASVRLAGGLLAQMAGAIGTHTVRVRATIGGNIAGWPYPTDGPTALAALRAELVFLSTSGPRTATLEDFYSNGAPDLREGELIVAVLIPRPPNGLRGAFRRVGRPRPWAPAVNCAAVARLHDGRMFDVRVVTSALRGVPAGLTAAESLLEGRRPTPGVLADAARRAGAVAEADGADSQRAEALTMAVREALRAAVTSEET
jgi:CO/xanthine dehydrogenase FAD-binding subunit